MFTVSKTFSSLIFSKVFFTLSFEEATSIAKAPCAGAEGFSERGSNIHLNFLKVASKSDSSSTNSEASISLLRAAKAITKPSSSEL